MATLFLVKATRADNMNKGHQLACAHSALIPLVIIGAGWFFIPGWFPPLSPDMTAAEIQAMYQENRMPIRIGMTLVAFSGAFWWSFGAAIAGQMRRIEGTADPILSRVQMGAAGGTSMVIILAAYFILAASYRPDMSADPIRIFHDWGWLMFIGCYPPGFLQNLSLGLCILSDKNTEKVYPRWLGFANIWFCIATIPGALLPFFHRGPFAWNGIIGFWVVALFFFAWIAVNWWFTVRAIRNQPDSGVHV
jgi:hypothetical protein